MSVQCITWNRNLPHFSSLQLHCQIVLTYVILLYEFTQGSEFGKMNVRHLIFFFFFTNNRIFNTSRPFYMAISDVSDGTFFRLLPEKGNSESGT